MNRTEVPGVSWLNRSTKRNMTLLRRFGGRLLAVALNRRDEPGLGLASSASAGCAKYAWPRLLLDTLGAPSRGRRHRPVGGSPGTRCDRLTADGQRATSRAGRHGPVPPGLGARQKGAAGLPRAARNGDAARMRARACATPP